MSVNLKWFHYLFIYTAWLIPPTIWALGMHLFYESEPAAFACLALTFPLVLMFGILGTMVIQQSFQKGRWLEMKWPGLCACVVAYFVPHWIWGMGIWATAEIYPRLNNVFLATLPVAIIIGVYFAERTKAIILNRTKNAYVTN
ncbi:MAG: hypothetical protein V1928_02030 [Parcubacteria group bacterium]